MPYNGPVIDAFYHPGWAATTADTFGDQESWRQDPQRARAMRFFDQGGDKPVTKPATAAESRQELVDNNVELAIFQASLYYQSTREELDSRILEHVDIMNQFPGQYEHAGTILPPKQGPATFWDVMENPRILEEHKEKYGIRGVHILPSPYGLPPNDRWFYPLFAKCVELDLFVFTYIGMPGPLWPTYPNYPLHLDDVCLAFPELTVVGHHIGDPWVGMMTHLAAKHKNLYICTSAWSPKRYPKELLEFMNGRWHAQPGAEKVIFGTDYPLINLSKAVTDARNLDLPEDVLEKFMYSNMKRILDAQDERAGK
ncbi:MAG: amidohydrolase family protein [Humibacter sp.]